jgi:low affinity Fe/Cu permease
MSYAAPREWLTWLGTATARPAAFLVFLAYVIARMAFGHLDWHSVATLATWAMTLFIQRAEHRDTQALHAKLDELLKVDEGAKDSLMNVDEKDAEEVERERDHVKKFSR